jgi:hypothetical protein
MNASGELYRFDGDSDKGKGKSQAQNLSDMFTWSGLVFHPDLDVNGDGTVDQLDVIAATCTGDLDQNGIIDNAELLAWIAAQPDPDNPVDINEDGDISALDVIADTCPYDVDQNGVIEYDGNFDKDTFPDSEFENWLADNTVTLADISAVRSKSAT